MNTDEIFRFHNGSFKNQIFFLSHVTLRTQGAYQKENAALAHEATLLL